MKPLKSIRNCLTVVLAGLGLAGPVIAQEPGPIRVSGSGGSSIQEILAPVNGTGGTVTTQGAYTVHIFNSGGTFTPPDGLTEFDVLIVGGGGGGGNAPGGNDRGGGGGAGGLLWLQNQTVGAASYTVTVGGGGSAGQQGGNSALAGVGTAVGGGAGGSAAAGGNGGSGGGGGKANNTAFSGGSGTGGQGNAGGAGAPGNGGGNRSAGGGGGATAAGAPGSGTTGGAGGTGQDMSAEFGTGVGENGVFARGGGGGGDAAGTGADTAINSGNGGGGATGGGAGTAGAPGVVIVRYIPPEKTFTTHTFTVDDTFVPPPGVDAVEVLVVGGGGGGGSSIPFGNAGSGGGGAGGVVYRSAFSIGGSVAVTVGAGGAGGDDPGAHETGANGGDSTFSTLTALGGGGGIGGNGQGASGGSGGGSRGAAGGVATQPGSASGGFGSRGGNSGGSPGGAAATGGGGAGGPGGDLAGVDGEAGSDGGVGIQYAISGTPTYYAGGGGGGGANNNGFGAGGLGGGGTGGNTATDPTPGSPNTGGGGGGGNDDTPGADGGSGIVIVRYLAPTMSIIQQPSAVATDGAPFPQQPVIELLNEDGTPISGENITATIASGTGTLGGTTTVPTDASGQAAFTDLSLSGNDTFTLEFSVGGLDDVLVSEAITVTADPYFLIGHDAPSVTCTPTRVTIGRYDGTGAIDTGYTGTISLSTDSGDGSWSLVSGGGTFSDGGGDGTATYTFTGGDNGEAVFEYSRTSTGTVNIDVSDGTYSELPSSDDELVIEDCEIRISHSGATDTCTPETVNFRIATTGGATVTGYTGTISISTGTGTGGWSLGGASGTLNAGPGDGTADYTFDPADAGIASLTFMPAAGGSVNFNATDGSITEDPGFDPDLVVSICQPSIFDTQCYNLNTTPQPVDVRSSAVADSSRMVLMYLFSESDGVGVTSASLSDGSNNYPLTYIHSELNTNVGIEVWGILDSALPATAETLDLSYTASGPWDATFGNRDPGACLVSLERTEQTLTYDTTPTTGQLAGFAGDTDDSILTITTPRDNSLVISAIGSGDAGADNIVSSLADELWDVGQGGADGPDSAFFHGHSELISGAGQVTVTEDTGGTAARVGHIFMALGPPVPGFSISHPGSGSACESHTVTIEARDAAGNINTGYTGTIDISTNTGNGYWVNDGGASGTFTTAGNGDGTATYTFAPADNGSIDLVFYNPNVEAVNFNIEDTTTGYMERSDADEDFNVTACGGGSISAGGLTCNVFTGNGGTITFNHTAGIPSDATEDRMVVVSWSGEEPDGVPFLSPASATFDGAPMQSVAFASVEDGFDNYTQILALNDSGLPAAAGTTYTVQISGAADDAAACAYTLTGVDQNYPPGNDPTLPVNINSQTSGNAISTTITTQVDDSYVISAVGNGGSGSYTGHTLANELYDTAIGGGGAVFSLSAETITPAQQLTVTDTASGANRSTQAVASFSPAPAGQPEYFSIVHNFTGGLCGANPVTISATDALNNVQTGYTGDIEISAGGSGDWSVDGSASGAFSNGTAGDGIATYTFDAADNGQVTFYFQAAGPGTINFDVEDINDASRTVNPVFDADLVMENCEYRISHDTTGGTCSPEDVQFSVVTTSGDPVAYTGTINLSTNSTTADKGTWTLEAGAGTLTDNTAKDGIASYAFDASDNGTVTLGFRQTDPFSVNFNVSGGGLPVNPSFDQDLVISDCAFRVSLTGGGTTDVCSLQEVAITAVDDAGTTLTDFTGQVTLDTSTGNGTWSTNGSENGSFSDPLENDGSATYTFVDADDGELTIDLSHPVTGTLNVDVETLDGSMQVDPMFDPGLTVELCSYRIIESDGSLTACSSETITIEVYQRDGTTLATDYTGSIDLSTSTGNGSWSLDTGNGTFLDGSGGDGAAVYTFDSADNGQATFSFTNTSTETLDVSVVDQLESDFVEDAVFDPTFEVTACLPSVFETICYSNQNQAGAISVRSQDATDDSRLVLMYIFTESSNSMASNARLQVGASTYPMTRIHFETETDVRMEVWGVNDQTLPDTAETFDAAFDGGPWEASFGTRNPGMCLVSVEGVEQETMPHPVLAAPPEDGQLNGGAYTSTDDSSLSVTTVENNSLVISAFGTGTNGADGVTSSLSNALWDLDNGDPDAPDSANFNGYSEIQPTAGTVTVTEDTGGSVDRAAHIVLALAPIVPGDPFASDYVPVNLFRTIAGNMSYRAIGSSFRENPNETTGGAPYTSSCTMAPSASETLPLPSGTTNIEAAYVYWAGSGSTAEIDDQVNFGPTGGEVGITADDVFQILNATGDGIDFFVAHKEVSSLISTATSQEYTMSGLTVDTGAPYNQNQTCLGGWGLVVVYQNPTENIFVNVINLFHGFQPFQNSSFTLVPRNFRMAAPDVVNNVPRGQITHITFEGDDTLNSGDEVFELQNDPDALTFEELHNPFNVGSAQYNDTISLPTYDGSFNFTGYQALSTTSYGSDVDTYYIAGPEDLGFDETDSPDNLLDILFPFGTAEAEEITTRYAAGQDLVLLASEVISVTNAPIADLEAFVSSAGSFKVGSSGTGEFVFDVTNNGNNAVSNGYADGELILTSQLPPGLTINNISADAHWDCSDQTASAFTCTFDMGTWTGGTTANQLDDGESLPGVTVAVDVGDETFFPLLNNTAEVVGRIAHFDSVASCDFTGIATGEQPDPTTCTKAEQFDNVNDLNKNTIDIDDLDEKQPNNNNVDNATASIRGIETDLTIGKAVVGVLEESQPAQYQLTVTNNGPDDTTKVISVTDTFPSTIPPISPGVIPGWDCSASSGQTISCSSTASIASGNSSTITVDTDPITATEGEFVSNTATVSAGAFNFDTVSGNNADTDISEVVGELVASNERFLISVSEAATIGVNTVAFESGDLLLYDPVSDEATLFMDSSGLSGTSLGDINAVHLLPNGQIVLSAANAGTLLGTSFEDEDLVLFDPILETATLIFDGSDPDKFGAGAGAADIDAVDIAFNDSFDPQEWDIAISTVADSTLGGTPFDDNDLIGFDMDTGNATVIFNGADADKFNGDNGSIDAAYRRFDNTDIYVLSTDDSADEGDVFLDAEPFTRDDLVEYDDTASSPMKADKIFVGDVANGVFMPASNTRRLDAVHLIEDGYYGHFAVQSADGDTCNAPTVTIRKHAGLSHTVDTGYSGTIRISNSTGGGNWILDASAGGTLNNTGGGDATYTFVSADNGEVILSLANTGSVSNVDVNVTNGIVAENSLEDIKFDVAVSTIDVEYFDDFGSVSYAGNDGSAVWSSDWVETGDDGAPGSGDVRVSSGKLRMTDGDGDNPAVTRDIDFDFDANEELLLGFRWARSNGTTGDQFQAQYNYNGGGWTTAGTFGNGQSGSISENAASIPLGITPSDGDTLQVRFRINSGLQLETVTLDDVKVTTSTDSNCNPGAVVDHYSITHSGNGFSCLATDVLIEAHDSGHNPVEPGAGTVIDLSTVNGQGSWINPGTGGTWSSSPLSDNGIASYTFQTGETSVLIPFNYTNPEADPAYNPTTQSVDVNFQVQDQDLIGQQEAQTLTINLAGLRFFNDSSGGGTFPTLVAGMDSFLYTGQTLVVQGIQASDEDPSVCEPLFDAGDQIVAELVLECVNPGSCSSGGLQAEITTGAGTTTINTVDSNGGSWIAAPDEAEFGTSPVTLQFQNYSNGDFGSGAYSGAEIRINYPDAGAMQIHGRYEIPLNDTIGGLASGNYMRGSGDNNFVVRPFGYGIDFYGDFDNDSSDEYDRLESFNDNGGDVTLAPSWASDANGSVFFTAGADFDTTVRAVAWEAADDADNDGIPDSGAFLFDNALTPNYGNESVASVDDVTLDHTLVQPVGGNAGTLTGTAFDNFADAGGEQTVTMSWSEVGIIDITATLDDMTGYLGSGESVTGSAPNIGRFIPADFEVSATSLTARPLFTPSAAPFTYMGEEFAVQFTLTARNADGNTTENYRGGFAKLSDASTGGGQIGFYAVDDIGSGTADVDYTPRIARGTADAFPSDFTTSWASGMPGQVTLSGNLVLNRQASGAPEAPLADLQIALTATDSDGVIDTDRTVDVDDGMTEPGASLYNLIGIHEFRYGRMLMENAYGSEIPEVDDMGNPIGEDIAVNFEVEYYDGTEFLLNIDDVATSYNSGDLVIDPEAPDASSYTGDLDTGNMNETDNVTTGSGVIYQGDTDGDNISDVPLYLQAPGEGITGSVVIELDLGSAGLEFLQYDWRDASADEIEDVTPDGDYTDNPRALIEFGVYPGNNRLINWQELF